MLKLAMSGDKDKSTKSWNVLFNRSTQLFKASSELFLNKKLIDIKKQRCEYIRQQSLIFALYIKKLKYLIFFLFLAIEGSKIYV